MEENDLIEYTSYKTSGRLVDHRSAISGLSTGLYTHSSSGESQGLPRFATAPRWTHGGGYRVNTFAAYRPFLDFLGRETFQMAMEDPSVVQSLTRYCEKAGFEENTTFLAKVSRNPRYPPVLDNNVAPLTYQDRSESITSLPTAWRRL